MVAGEDSPVAVDSAVAEVVDLVASVAEALVVAVQAEAGNNLSLIPSKHSLPISSV
jgi:hypothetical protein